MIAQEINYKVGCIDIVRQYCFRLQVLYVIAHSFPISACIAKDVCTLRQEEAPDCRSLRNDSQGRDTSVDVFVADVLISGSFCRHCHVLVARLVRA